MGEPALDIEDVLALAEYLRRRGVLKDGESAAIRKLEGGVSNRVMLVARQGAQAFVMKQALEKLRVAVDWYCTPARIEREALALRYLRDLAPSGTIPAILFEDHEHFLLAMEAVSEPHRNWKQMLLAGEINLDHAGQFGQLLGTIHSRSANDEHLAEVFGDRSVFETLRLEPYYRYTAAQIAGAAGFVGSLLRDTLACRLSLVHGDYSPKNILIHEGRLVLLDCEVVHYGDPAFDTGFALAHFLGKANHLREHRAAFAEAALRYWGSYCEVAEDSIAIDLLEPRAVRHTLACTLARVAGRSPLEYLTADERDEQAAIVLDLMRKPTTTIGEAISEFMKQLACR